MDRHRTFYLTWKDPSLGSRPTEWLSLIAKIARPRRMEIHIPWEIKEDVWQSNIDHPSNQHLPPENDEWEALLINERRLSFLGLTKFIDVPDDSWRQWLGPKIESIGRQFSSNDPSNWLWIRSWGDTRLSQLPGSEQGDQWIGRQEFPEIAPFTEEWKSRFEPILEFTTAVNRETLRIDFLGICINSSVYTSLEMYPFFSSLDASEPWLPDFVNRNVDIFCAWMSEVSRTITLTSVEWETTYRHEYGSELEPIFEELLGPPVSRA